MANTNKKTVYTRIQNKHDLEVEMEESTEIIEPSAPATDTRKNQEIYSISERPRTQYNGGG